MDFLPELVTRRAFLELTGAVAFGVAGACSRKPSNREEPQLLPASRIEARDEVLIFVCGDVMTGRGIDQVLPHPSAPRIYESVVEDAREYVELAERLNGEIPRPVDYAYIWGDALAELRERAPHVRLVNLETSVTTSSSPVPKGINYRMHPKNVPCLSAAGLDCCVLANNHVLDWDVAGLLETLTVLERAGMKCAGAGRTEREASAPAIFQINADCRVLVYAFATESSGVPPSWAATPESPGVSFLDDFSARTIKRIRALVDAVKRPSDIVIASIHWGGNWGYHIPEVHRRFAHALIDEASIDILHGHSSHHPKGIEVYRSKPILYGCGDFLNDYEGITGYEEFRGDLALMYFVRMQPSTGHLKSLELVPLQIRRFSMHRATSADAYFLAEILRREGAELGTRVERTQEGRFHLSWARATSP